MPQAAIQPDKKTPTHYQTRFPCIDTDLHPAPSSMEAWLQYLDEPWRSRIRRNGNGGAGHGYLNPHGVHRRDAHLPDGRSIASDPEATIREHMKTFGIAKAILIPANLGMGVNPDPDRTAAQCRAHNDFFLNHWLNPHPEFNGSIMVSSRDIQLAVREIDRLADEKRFVQVVMSSAQPMPLGERLFHPLYEACQRHGLPLALHPGAEGGGVSNAPTPAGWVSRYMEWHTCLSLNYQAHLVSLIGEGVFELFPELKVILVEGGIAWLPPLMWRFDKNYKALRCETPWLKRRPSEYLAGHVWLTTQPIEEPDKPGHLKQLFEMFDAKRMLMFSSDFPHWDGDSPEFVTRGFDDDFKKRVLYQNACDVYGLTVEDKSGQG